MPKTEHDAPSAKELREAMKWAVRKLLDMEPSDAINNVAYELNRLASGPTLEERQGENLYRAQLELDRAATQEEHDAARRNWNKALGEMLGPIYARKLSEEAGG